jgi:tRNA 2-(methylsulfanyl)-N6-isopentenyladenosine37 hydroxylase
MLGFIAPTRPDWLPRVVRQLDEVLVDHAHCEKKAAGAAVSLLFRCAGYPSFLEPLSQLAGEELVHFRAVLGILAKRGIAFRRQRPSPYAGRLLRAARNFEPARLVDEFLCCALIEARSCERFRILADGLPDRELAHFYRGLLAAEARHHGVYVDLAAELMPRPEVRARLRELAEHEAQVLSEMPTLPRLHT